MYERECHDDAKVNSPFLVDPNSGSMVVAATLLLHPQDGVARKAKVIRGVLSRNLDRAV